MKLLTFFARQHVLGIDSRHRNDYSLGQRHPLRLHRWVIGNQARSGRGRKISGGYLTHVSRMNVWTLEKAWVGVCPLST